MTRSISFETNERLEIGRYFFGSSGSSVVFLSFGKIKKKKKGLKYEYSSTHIVL